MDATRLTARSSKSIARRSNRQRRRPKHALVVALTCIAVASALSATRGWWQPAPIDLPERIETRDRTPLVLARIGGGTSPDTSRLVVRIDGKPARARMRVTASTLALQLPRLGEGSHSVTLTRPRSVTSPRASSHRMTISVDTRAPRAKINISQAPAAAGSARVSVRIDTEQGVRATVITASESTALQVKDGVARHTVVLAEGSHKIKVEARDRTGNRTVVRRTFWVDATAPAITQVVVPAVARTARPVIAAKAGDNRPAALLVAKASVDGIQLDARVAVDGQISVQPKRPLSEGDHELTLTVRDRAGNHATASRSFTVDSTDALGAATLRSGARGADVKLLQQELARPSAWASAPPTLQMDGHYDSATTEAVRAFQSEQGLGVDGVAGPFTIAALTLRITIDQSSHKLVLFRYGKPFRSYPITVGSPKYPTPNGTFRIVDKQKNPTWTPPDSAWAKDEKVTPPGPDNPLGTRWMGLDSPGIGIHGTNSPASLGYSVSHGCIRMSIPHVEELFDLVREGTRVEVRL